jgi:hypothetical protein
VYFVQLRIAVFAFIVKRFRVFVPLQPS